jgi:hypothetical protein
LSDVATPWLAAANVVGWLAAAMTLLTFHCNDMLRLRLLALSSNVAFVAYGLAAGLLPVLALHLLLIPLNLLRLRQVRRVLRVVASPVPVAAAASAPLGPTPASAREAVARVQRGAGRLLIVAAQGQPSHLACRRSTGAGARAGNRHAAPGARPPAGRQDDRGRRGAGPHRRAAAAACRGAPLTWTAPRRC